MNWQERAEKAEAELAKLREQERERCAQLCEWLPVGTGYEGKTFAEAIRGNGLGGKLADGFIPSTFRITEPVPAPAVPKASDRHVCGLQGFGNSLDDVCHACAREHQQIIAPAVPAPSVPEEWLKCWLIERPAFSEWPAIWLTITTDGRRWVSDGGTMYASGGDWYFTTAAVEALKFADKESADEYVRHNKIKDVVVTEHIFDNRSPAAIHRGAP